MGGIKREGYRPEIVFARFDLQGAPVISTRVGTLVWGRGIFWSGGGICNRCGCTCPTEVRLERPHLWRGGVVSNFGERWPRQGHPFLWEITYI